MQKLAMLVVLVFSSLAYSVASAPLTAVAALATTPQPVGQTSGAWNMVFNDEFSGTSLDRTKWTPGWFGTGITGPVNSAENACYDSKHVSTPGDGNLHLLLDATPNTCKGKSMPYTGALISSNGLFQYAYGYIEFRAYLPASSAGQIANWPGTWSDGQSWPTDGENDTMEGLGGPACYHFHSTVGGPGSCASGDFTGWHTFASNWAPGVVTYFYDGKQVGQITSGITSVPQYLILQYTVNGSRVASVPNEMLVDYVRVWTPATATGSNSCSAVSVSTSMASPQQKGRTVQVNAAATGCPTPLYEFWTLAPNASLYTLAQAYSSSATFSWDTTAALSGTYRIAVWVRDATSNGLNGNASGRWDAYNAGTVFTLTDGCPAVSSSTVPQVSAMAGMNVGVSAVASGCTSPLYEFWVLAPGATLYTLGQAYSTTPTFNWNTAGLRLGTYRVNVWVRDSSSTGVFGNSSGRWDAYNANLTVNLTAGCPSVSDGATPSTAAAGATVAFTAASPGCASPLYAFWVLAPGASLYTLGQDYSTSPVFNWSTSGKPAGTYRVTVWVRDSSSTGVFGNASGRWDAYNASLLFRVS